MIIIYVLYKYDLADSTQSAYKKYHSIETSLLKGQTVMLEVLDNGNTSIFVVINLWMNGTKTFYL